MKKMNFLFFIFFIFTIFSKVIYADSPIPINMNDGTWTPQTHAEQQQKITEEEKDSMMKTIVTASVMAEKIPLVLTTPIEIVQDKMQPIMERNKSIILIIFQVLFTIEVCYTLAKAYLEGNYQNIVSTFITRAFFASIFYTFILGGFYFSIPIEVVKNMFGTSANINFNDPLATAQSMLKGICAPWAKFAVAYYDAAWAGVKASLAIPGIGAIIALPDLFMIVLATIIIWLGWFIVAQICFTYIMKLIEITIGLAVVIFFLGLKGAKTTDSYFETAIKYILTAGIDLAILSLVSGIGEKLLNGQTPGAGFSILFTALFSLIIWMTLYKVATKIGSGIASGSPKVTYADASAVLQSVTQVGAALAGPAALMGAGAAMVGGAVGGGIAGAMGGGGLKGALAGAGSGAQKGISIGKAGVKAAGKVAGKPLGGSTLASMSGQY